MYGLTEIQLMNAQVVKPTTPAKQFTQTHCMMHELWGVWYAARTYHVSFEEVLAISLQIPFTHGEWEQRQNQKGI